MKARFTRIAGGLRDSFWFVPALLVLAGIGLALGLIELDERAEPGWVATVPWIFGGGAEGARGLLSSIASSMITVTGVTFSITVVALTLAAQQYTPRVLREFTADRGNQVVLGTFLGTYAYALLVLRTIRKEEFGDFVPHIAVTGAVALALASVGLLVFFIHHVSSAIRPNSILSVVVAQGHGLIDHLFPQELGEGATEAQTSAARLPDEPGEVVGAPATGYLQAIDSDRLMRIAREHDLLVRMDAGIGDFLSQGAPLFAVWPSGRDGEAASSRLAACASVAPDRTIQQDLEFAFLQIVDIAVKALSPGINDPTTAKNCLDHLGDLLRHVGRRHIPSPFRTDEEGSLRVIACSPDFQRLADLAFDDIRRYAEGDTGVALHLLHTLRQVGAGLESEERRGHLRQHVLKIEEGAERAIHAPADLREVRHRVREVLEMLRTETPRSADGTVPRLRIS